VLPSLTVALALGFAGSALAQLEARAGEWPAWRGPDRTGISKETGLLKQWPKEGPNLIWKATGLGDGFSTPSVAGGKVYLLGARGGKTEYLIALDARNGKELWATPFGQMAGGHAGPRSTPTVDGDSVYVISSNGILICADADKGAIRWQKNFKTDFSGRSGGWAYAESPLIDGDVLVCTPGADDAALVALNKKDGEVIWKSAIKGLPQGRRRSYTTAGYSSVIVAEADGVKQYIQFLNGGVVGVDARDGKFLWNYDSPANGTANCSTPLFQDDCVFAASAYGTGGGLAVLKKEGDKFTATQKYFVKGMQNHHGGMVLVDGHIYGTGGNTLLCVNFKTGEIAWQDRSVGKGSVAYADGHLYVRGEKGPIALVEATPTGYKEKGRFQQPDRSEKNAWPHPVVAGGKLYIRDWDILLCYDVSEAK
jgi:outer membrane protein assembly factor BamB